MTQRERTLQFVFLTLLAVFPVTFVSVQSTTAALEGQILKAPSSMKYVKERARNYRPTAHQEQRMLKQFGQECQDRIAEDPALKCPNYNDREAVRKFLLTKDETAKATHGAATGSSSTLLSLEALSETDQTLMRWYQNARTCPETLKSHTAGFYELCKKLLLTTESRSERRGIPEKVEQRVKAVRDLRAGEEAARAERKAKRERQRQQREEQE